MKYFSLFAGIGGLEYGAHKRGFECAGISEIRESSIKIYKKNYGEVQNFGDITKIVPAELPDFNILTGGFPCQSFSLAGRRGGFADRRGKMIFYIYDILVEKRPDFFVLENVKGISTHDGGNTIKKVMELLTDAGYYVRVVLLNSANYGSAQARERMIFLGSRDFNFPVKYPEIVDDTKTFKDVREKDVEFAWLKRGPRVEKKLRHLNGFNFQMIGDYDKTGTVMTDGGRGNMVIWEKDAFRYLTPLECERLQGFPEGWTEGVSQGDRYFALGNAVSCHMSDYLFNNYLEGLWFNVK